MKARCRKCYYFDFSPFMAQFGETCQMQREKANRTGEHFCGQHGGAEIDPDGEQRSLDRKGSCNFVPEKTTRQLTIFDLL